MTYPLQKNGTRIEKQFSYRKSAGSTDSAGKKEKQVHLCTAQTEGCVSGEPLNQKQWFENIITKGELDLMKKIIICPHCGKVHVAVPAKSKRNEIVLISTGLHLSDLPSLFDRPDNEQDMKNTKKETKYHD